MSAIERQFSDLDLVGDGLDQSSHCVYRNYTRGDGNTPVGGVPFCAKLNYAPCQYMYLPENECPVVSPTTINLQDIK